MQFFYFEFDNSKNIPGQHWAAFVFDRSRSYFHYFDPLAANREERFDAAVIIERSFLDRYERLYSFTAACLPVTGARQATDMQHGTISKQLHQ
jgi:deoxyribodipyrimidine photolyase